MSAHTASTFVFCKVVDEDEEAAAARLREHAIMRLGGEEGLEHVETNRVGDRLNATYVRQWHDKPAEEDAGDQERELP